MISVICHSIFVGLHNGLKTLIGSWVASGFQWQIVSAGTAPNWPGRVCLIFYHILALCGNTMLIKWKVINNT